MIHGSVKFASKTLDWWRLFSRVLACWIIFPISYEKSAAVFAALSVVDRGIEPLCQDWESCILTIRWIDHLFFTLSGSWGIRTPGTLIAHGSLANCWFQPLTQTSLPKRFSLNYISLLKCECKDRHIFLYHQTFDELFLKKLFFSTSISVFRQFLQSLIQKKGSQTTFLRLVLSR